MTIGKRAVFFCLLFFAPPIPVLLSFWREKEVYVVAFKQRARLLKRASRLSNWRECRPRFGDTVHVPIWQKKFFFSFRLGRLKILVLKNHIVHEVGCFPISCHICLWTKNNFESYFNDRLTFSHIWGRTSRQIYRLALPLRTPVTLSSSSKSRIVLYNAHLALFIQRMIQLRLHKLIGNYRHLVNRALEVRTLLLPVTDQTTSRIVVDWERMWMWGPLEKRFTISVWALHAPVFLAICFATALLQWKWNLFLVVN